MNVRKSVKLIVSAILLAALMSALCVNIFAGNDLIAPTWNSILSVKVDLNFDGNEGCASGEAIQKSTATAIDAYLYVYKLVEDEWVYVRSIIRWSAGNGQDVYRCKRRYIQGGIDRYRIYRRLRKKSRKNDS